MALAHNRTTRTLGRRASFWTAAAVAALALWTSGAPSVSYPLYAAEWHLTPTRTNAIFAVYPIVLVVVLIVLGDLSDHVGRRASIVPRRRPRGSPWPRWSAGPSCSTRRTRCTSTTGCWR